MARPREFDEDEAIRGAMSVFWQLGYDGASMPDLLAGMNLTRGSLYKAFNDKKSLFLIALKRYEREAVGPAVTLLTDTSIKDGTQRIAALFETILDAVRQGDRRGCMLCSAAAGPAAYDDDIAHDVHQLISQMQQAFTRSLEASPAHHHLTATEREHLAASLTTQYAGLRTLARSRTPLSMLAQSVAGLSAQLRSGQ